MYITASFASFTGNRASSTAAEYALSGYKSDGRSLGRAAPMIQARPGRHMSEHVKVVGLLLDWGEHDSDTMLSPVSPVSITCGNGVESASG